ncbi:hypothetical protein PRUPE_2G188600 [Prunus persica]|uniref:Uncharacterized protein n=1 Tax=Prunus persica TaxID=3760 RepID=A0A251QJ21_PRUPE|nr:uncharacterized protein LOC109947693 [Prunus persica]ONI23420.1 hypothetical protein PRUPE_2G188600 [Prunus persica]ONI23421.1 hypothetical protein PRUPE_2G188600 [Prunus persica]
MDSVVTKHAFSSFKLGPSQTQQPLHTTTTHFSFFRFSHFKKLRKSTSSISCSHIPPSNPRRPKSIWDSHNFPLNPIWFLVPVLQSIRVLASSRTQKWVSFLQAYRGTECVVHEKNNDFLHNSGIGVALLSVTSNAKVKISPFVAQLAANPTFVSGLFAWFMAQSTKVLLNFFVERKWDFRILYASGGMPSSHSALCTALTTSVALCHGVADSLFPVCLGFSLIVMYDAIGVRRHAGMQAEVLNIVVEYLFEGHPISQKKLKELLGHTPSQVIAGALLGIVVACVCCQGSLVAT